MSPTIAEAASADSDASSGSQAAFAELRALLGPDHVLTLPEAIAPYFRSTLARGTAPRAVLRPDTTEEVAEISLKAVSDNPVFIPPDPRNPAGRMLSNGGYHNGKAYPALDNLAAAW